MRRHGKSVRHSTVDEKGRLLIPDAIRKQLGIEAGDIFFVQVEDTGVLRYARAQNPSTFSPSTQSASTEWAGQEDSGTSQKEQASTSTVSDRYEVDLTRHAEKDLKALRAWMGDVLRHLTRLERDPEAGHLLKGALRLPRTRIQSQGQWRLSGRLRRQPRRSKFAPCSHRTSRESLPGGGTPGCRPPQVRRDPRSRLAPDSSLNGDQALCFGLDRFFTNSTPRPGASGRVMLLRS